MIKISIKKLTPKWIFLLTVTVLYLLIFLYDSESANDVMLQFLSIIREIVPVFIVVFFIMFLLGLFLNNKKIKELLGDSSGIKGWIISITGGILSSGPIYMWYPLIADLKKEGMKNSLITVFLYNRAIKIPFLPVMVQYFGLSFTIMLTLYMILFSIINGLLINKLL
ncbi:MAG: permease [Patescibacteria group bacterium]